MNFFLLEDLVDAAASMIKFFTPFDDFAASPLPRPLNTYLAYRGAAMEFIDARNHRIAALINA